MSREADLEAALRRWVVSFENGGHKCHECTGKWTRLENERGAERHVATCVLFRSATHNEAPALPPIPF